MRQFRFLVLATAATGGVLLAPAFASAHDLRARITVTESVKLEAFFDDGMPAELADARVTDAAGNEVLVGKTDEHGVWTFRRPAPGRYTLTVKSIGHVAKVEFPVEGESEAAPAVYTEWRMSKPLGLAIGLIPLLGLSAVGWFLQRRRRG